jgi:N-acylglucosamine 2-epimerase/mannose-6-phosphate isomerase
VSPQGAVIDPTPDLYDYAFVLFALGWRYKVRQERAALALAHQTLDLIETRFAHANGAGFHAALPASLPREQNPHMHLTEAALVLAQASGEQRFFDLAQRVILLFKTRIMQSDTGVLPEFFDDDWAPIAGERGRRVEPGHQFEWAWILAQHQQLSGQDHRDAVATLVGFAETHGVDPATNITFNAVRDDGVLIDRGSRTWPNTERVKGWIGHAALNGVDARSAVEGSLRVLLRRYLAPAPRGCWIDAFDADGARAVETIPASTLYHVFLAFAEALRFADAQQ